MFWSDCPLRAALPGPPAAAVGDGGDLRDAQPSSPRVTDAVEHRRRHRQRCNRNAPYVVVRMLGELSVIGAFVVVAFVATSALRDFERGTDDLVFSRPVRPRDLLLGRFVGSRRRPPAPAVRLRTLGLLRGQPHAVARSRARRAVRPAAASRSGSRSLAWPTLGHPRRPPRLRWRRRVRHVDRPSTSALVGLLVAYFAARRMFSRSRAPAARPRSSIRSASAPSSCRSATGRSRNRTRGFPAMTGDLLVEPAAVARRFARGPRLGASARFSYDRSRRPVVSVDAVQRRSESSATDAPRPRGGARRPAFASRHGVGAARSRSSRLETRTHRARQPALPADPRVRADQRARQHRAARPDDGHAGVAGHVPDAAGRSRGLLVPARS